MSIIRAIKLLNPNAKVTVYNNDIDQIIWHEDTQPIEKNLILAYHIFLDKSWLE